MADRLCNEIADIPLFLFVCPSDLDLLPHFLSHYRQAGIGRFEVTLHKDKDGELATFFDLHPDCHIRKNVNDNFTETLKILHLNNMILAHPEQWALHVDADEFIELPFGNLRKTIESLEQFGSNTLPAWLVQRLAPDGSLPMLNRSDKIENVFSAYDFNLCEKMNLQRPCWKQKFPLFKISEGFKLERGNHLPPNGTAGFHHPIRAILSHYKWRHSIFSAFRQSRGLDTNFMEMDKYRAWIRANGNKIPNWGARKYSCSEMIRRGLLVTPTEVHLRRANLANQVFSCQPVDRQSSIAKLKTDYKDWSDTEELDLLDHLGSATGKICFVTFELVGPMRSDGIGTAISSLAERLSAVGHTVEIVYCPHKPENQMADLWYLYWSTRGIKVHQLPRYGQEGSRWPEPEIFRMHLARYLSKQMYDVIHFDDAGDFGYDIPVLRVAGIDFQKTKIITTCHGPGYWHFRGNQMPWSDGEADNTHSTAHQIRLSDKVLYPSHYMKGFVESDLELAKPLRTSHVIRNVLPGLSRSFKVTSKEMRAVDEIVFFGRIEKRKGLYQFIDTVTKLPSLSKKSCRFTFLGKIGFEESETDLRSRLGDIPNVIFLTNFDSVEAINYLKTNNCLVILPSTQDNLPYTVYECLENCIPMVTTKVGGIPELIHPEDHERIMIANDSSKLLECILHALKKGFLPGRLAFDPELAALQQLAVFASAIGDKAKPIRETKNQLDIIVYSNPSSVHPKLINTLLDWKKKGMTSQTLTVSTEDHRTPGAQISAFLKESNCPEILFIKGSIVPTPDALCRLMQLMTNGSYDAVVCDYRIAVTAGYQEEPIEVSEVFHSPAGPIEQAPSKNLFGPGFFVISRETLGSVSDSIPGFNVRTLHWEILNKVASRRGKIGGVPSPLVIDYVKHPSELIPIQDLFLIERLTNSWIKNMPRDQEYLIRKSILRDSGNCQYNSAAHRFVDSHFGRAKIP